MRQRCGARAGCERQSGRDAHQAVQTGAGREGCTRGANARFPAQPGVRVADSCGCDFGVVALAYESEVDFSARMVAVVNPARTANALNESPVPLIVILLGPTGSGKTALSLELAERLGGEIVSCDSVAVYRGMELGTAKPTKDERARAPHHLIDVAEPNEPVTAGEYSRPARVALREIASREHLPIGKREKSVY